jgi:hypothetical protein
MSTKPLPQPGADLLTDRWEPETHEVIIMFTFNPYDPENEESLTRGLVCTKCNLIEHDCAENFCLEKCLLLGVDVISAYGACGAPLSPLFLSLYMGESAEIPIRSVVAGSDGKYPLGLAGVHSEMFRRKPDAKEVETARRDFGALDDRKVAAYLDATVQSKNEVLVPGTLLPYIEGCFERSAETSLEKPRRARQAVENKGHVLLQKGEYAFCRDKIQEVLAEVRESFDDATTVHAELSCDKGKNIAAQICDQPYYAFVKIIFKCN